MRADHNKGSSDRQRASKLTFRALAIWLTMLLVTVWAIWSIRPPRALPASAPDELFSAERALIYVRTIAQTPHPIGSSRQTEVRSYLIDQLKRLGLQPQTYSGIGIASRGSDINAGKVTDIVGRLPGDANSRAILLMAHYDSTRHAPGAADDGASVAAILESVRAIRASTRLKNDLIVLFTDGEEAGLLGAEAFAHNHPWVNDLGLILNFEARGNRGPSLLFETTAGNSLLIEAVRKACPDAVGSSLFYSLYQLLPNNTDLSVFRHSGIPGLNFAFGNGLEAYHTRLDSAETLSPDSVQHQGSYALLLTKHFGQMDLTKLPARDDRMFFNLFGKGLITYPQNWVPWLELLLTIGLSALLIYGYRRKQVRLRAVALASLAMLASLVCLPIILAIVWAILSRGFRVEILLGDTRSNNFLLAGLALVGITVGVLIWRWLFRAQSPLTLTFAALVCMLGLSWLFVIRIASGSYLLQWPLLLAELALLATLVGKRGERDVFWWAVIPAVVCALLLFAPLLYLVYVFFTIGYVIAIVTGVFVAILFIIATDLIRPALPDSPGWLLPGVLLFCACACLIYGSALSHYSRLSPSLDSLNYSFEADQGAAAWISSDQAPDAWVQLTLPASSRRLQAMTDYLAGTDFPVWTARAPLFGLPAPHVDIQAAAQSSRIRTLHVVVHSRRDANIVYVAVGPSVKILTANIEGREVPIASNIERKPALSTISLYGWGQETVRISLEIESASRPVMWVADSSEGLPGQVPPRSSQYIASYGSDVSLVSRRLDLSNNHTDPGP